MKRRLLSVSLAAALLLPACTWIPLSAGGAAVKVRDADAVTACRRLGQTQVSVLDHVGPVQRGVGKVQYELEVLARNAAPGLGGDTVVAVTPIRDGKQTFDVYRCGNP